MRLIETIRVRAQAVQTLRQIHEDFAERKSAAGRGPTSPRLATRLAREIEQNSFAILPGFLTAKEAEHLRSEVDRLFEAFPTCVKPDAFAADHRLFGAEHGSHAIAQFHGDEHLRCIGQQVLGTKLKVAATLAARLDAQPGNLGSGQGWHRDSLYGQFKAIVYLSDVGIDNGPFEILAGSHHLSWQIHDILRFGLDPTNSRLSDTFAKRIVESRPWAFRRVTAPAGTAIVVNTNAIHRGSPILAGRRYALTNYVYPEFQLDSDFMRKFEPLLTPMIVAGGSLASVPSGGSADQHTAKAEQSNAVA